MQLGADFSGTCLHCRYPLRSVPEPRCPECGRRFNPADPNSYGGPAGADNHLFHSYRRVQKAFAVFAFVSAGWMFAFGSAPGGGYFVLLLLSMFVLLLPLGLAGLWLAIQIVQVWHCGALGELARWPQFRWKPAALGLALLMGVCVSIPFRGPIYVTFALSRPILDHLADQVAEHPDAEWTGWAGLYPLGGTSRLDDGTVLIVVSGVGFLDRYGFARAQPGRTLSPAAGNVRFRPFWGDWYIFREDF